MLFCFLILCLVVLNTEAQKDEGCPVFQLPADAKGTGCHIIVLKEETSDAKMEELMEIVSELSEDLIIYTSVKTVAKAFTVRLSPESLEMVRMMPEVDYIEEEGYVQATAQEWHLDRLDQISSTLDNQYQPIGDGTGVDVYILDTGINFDHEEFESRALYPGFDAVDYYCEVNATDPFCGNQTQQFGRDCFGHGTWVASLCGGKTYGAAKNVTLYSVRVLGCDGTGIFSTAIAGVEFVATRAEKTDRPIIMSMSFGGPASNAFNQIVENAVRKGIFSVGSAGNVVNDACTTSPGNSPSVMTVAGTREGDGLYSTPSGTSFGPCVDIFAPGQDILAAFFNCDNCTLRASGTSASAPLVSGLAAIMLGREPSLTPSIVKERLISDSIKNAVDYGSRSSIYKNTPNRLAHILGSCGGRYPPLSRAILYSPNFPDLYPPNLDCEWFMEEEMEIQVTVEIFQLNLQPPHDILQVCDGYCEDKSSLVEELTGEIMSYTFTSTGNIICIRLITDESNSASGFNGTFTPFFVHVNECAINNGGCAQMCMDTDRSFQCSCEVGYRLLPDNLNCEEFPFTLTLINSSPRVSNNLTALEFMSLKPITSARCTLLLGGPEVDCSSGIVRYRDVSPGSYRLRIIAIAITGEMATLRRPIFICDDEASSCGVNLINEGVTVTGDCARIQFLRCGPAKSYLCKLDEEPFKPCLSPLQYCGLETGQHELQVLPSGEECEEAESLSTEFTIA